jgi:hypothetical protein
LDLRYEEFETEAFEYARKILLLNYLLIINIGSLCNLFSIY